MLDFFRAGGFPMIIITALGAVAVVTAIRFAITPLPRRLAVLRALTWALVFTIGSGVASDLMATFSHISRNEDWLREPLAPLLGGLGESMAPAVLGFSLLGVIWMIVAAGVRRAGDGLDPR